MSSDNLDDRRYAGMYRREDLAKHKAPVSICTEASTAIDPFPGGDQDLALKKEIANIMIDAVGEMDRGKNLKEISREITFGPIGVRFTWRSGNRFMGRFGGGWNWALGFKACRGSVLINLLFCSILISRCKNGN